MDYLVFATLIEAETGAETIYKNMVEAIDSADLLNVDTGKVVPKSDLTPSEAVQVSAGNRYYPVFGVNGRSLEKDSEQGYTTAWAMTRKTLQGKFVYAKPQDSLLKGVVGFTVEPFDPSWFPE